MQIINQYLNTCETKTNNTLNSLICFIIKASKAIQSTVNNTVTSRENRRKKINDIDINLINVKKNEIDEVYLEDQIADLIDYISNQLFPLKSNL